MSEATPTPDPDLSRLAKKVEGDATFFAYLLKQYAAHNALDEAALCAEIGIATHRLPELALCRAPRPESDVADVQAIADHFGVSRTPVLRIFRQVTLTADLQRDSAAAQNVEWTVAAREAPPADGGEAS